MSFNNTKLLGLIKNKKTKFISIDKEIKQNDKNLLILMNINNLLNQKIKGKIPGKKKIIKKINKFF
ncbi:MAG: hypothetical protein CEE43_19170 [Promethearchaeota archaeon Loki_b32]|nr:MAG: hypothetical protein CEE43_19170 [Candidatus Lokiarchaeota archaeon Loki_b32]